jgi:hypothetical protein
MNSKDLSFIQQNTNLKLDSIKDFYSKFIHKYTNGYVNREQFNVIIKRMIIDDQTASNHGQDENEKLLMSNRLFDICDIDEDGCIDFKVICFSYYKIIKIKKFF